MRNTAEAIRNISSRQFHWNIQMSSIQQPSTLNTSPSVLWLSSHNRLHQFSNTPNATKHPRIFSTQQLSCLNTPILALGLSFYNQSNSYTYRHQSNLSNPPKHSKFLYTTIITIQYTTFSPRAIIPSSILPIYYYRSNISNPQNQCNFPTRNPWSENFDSDTSIRIKSVLTQATLVDKSAQSPNLPH